MKTRRILSLMLVFALVLTLFAGCKTKTEDPTTAPTTPSTPTAPNTSDVAIQDGVTLHCWNWSFKEIAAKMEIIAALGYTSIQTSPIQSAKQPTSGFPTNDWWVYYQPRAFQIETSESSALGTKADFEAMCETAHKHGIKVIVDIVANHMANTETGANGLANTIVPDLKDDPACWHDITKNTNNYNDRKEVTQYCMAGLPDLNTSNEKVQNHVLNLLKECIDAGADGFRFDAVKHIETPDDGALASNFWPFVINGAKEYAQSSRNFELYCYGELLDSPGGSLGVDAYTKYMSITDNVWSNNLLREMVMGNASGFSSGYRKNAAANQLVLWAESHDTFADGSTAKTDISYINKTWALIAARADAMGLYLARPANTSQLLGAASNTAWCYPEVAAVNRFHTQFIGQSEYVANENGIAYVVRGTAGAVLVNADGDAASVSVDAHGMADGTYTDQITGNSFTVSGGKLSGNIGDTGIAVVTTGTACAHTAHDLDGFCTACLANVGHQYDDAGKCACGDEVTPTRTIYFINTAGWTTVNYYSWYNDIDIVTSAWPGDPMTKVNDTTYSCVVPVDVPNIIFNNGTDQTENLLVPKSNNTYDFSTGKWTTT